MKYIIPKLIILLSLTTISYAGNSELRPVEMNIAPSAITKTTQQIRFLPKEDDLIDGDSVPLYEKAIKSLPYDYPEYKFSDWRSLPPEQLPVKEVESEINKLKPTLDLLTQATKSKKCSWPKMTLEQAQQQTNTDVLSKYRQLAFILDVKAKTEIQQKQYDKAVETIKTGLTMSKHLGEAPILSQGLVAIAIAALNLGRAEELIQSDNSPNLYEALTSLPQPFVDIEKAIQYEKDNFQPSNPLTRIFLRQYAQKQMEPALERIRKQMNHLDRKIATLQIIEALRLHAGSDEGKLPEKLNDVTDYKIPQDPVTNKPFKYTKTDSGAIIETEGTENSNGRDAIRYELKMKK